MRVSSYTYPLDRNLDRPNSQETGNETCARLAGLRLVFVIPSV
jgi:hypothetical protein